MRLKKALKIGSLALLLIILGSLRFGQNLGVANYGSWQPTADIRLEKVTIKSGKDTRYTAHIGAGNDVIIATITEENIEVSPTVYFPIFQFGKASGNAEVSFALNGQPAGTTDVSVHDDYNMFGLLPNLSVRSEIRRKINRAITHTVETRIKEFHRLERLKQTIREEAK